MEPMTSPRNLLLIALLFIAYLLYTAWQEDYNGAAPANGTAATSAPASDTPSTPATAASGEKPSVSTPALTPESGTTPQPPTATSTGASPHVVATTDVLRIEIDTHGGNVVAADLLAYPQEPKDYAHPVRILDSS